MSGVTTGTCGIAAGLGAGAVEGLSVGALDGVGAGAATAGDVGEGAEPGEGAGAGAPVGPGAVTGLALVCSSGSVAGLQAVHRELACRAMSRTVFIASSTGSDAAVGNCSLRSVVRPILLARESWRDRLAEALYRELLAQVGQRAGGLGGEVVDRLDRGGLAVGLVVREEIGGAGIGLAAEVRQGARGPVEVALLGEVLGLGEALARLLELELTAGGVGAVERELDGLDAALDPVEHVARDGLGARGDDADATDRDDGRGAETGDATTDTARARRGHRGRRGASVRGQERGGLGHEAVAQGLTEVVRRCDGGRRGAEGFGVADEVGDSSIGGRAPEGGLERIGLALVARHDSCLEAVVWLEERTTMRRLELRIMTRNGRMNVIGRPPSRSWRAGGPRGAAAA